MNDHVNNYQDYFNSVGEFIQWLKTLFGQGLTEIKDIPDFFKNCYLKIEYFLGAYIHPFFIPYVSFAIAVALIHKFCRFGGKA